MDLVANQIRPALAGCAKDLFPMAKRVRASINTVLSNLGLEEVQWERGERCVCQTCNYSRGASKKWRMQYWLILQNVDTLSRIPSLLDIYVLRSLLYKAFAARARVDHYEGVCAQQGITNVWELYSFVRTDRDLPYQKGLDRDAIRHALHVSILEKVGRVVGRGKQRELVRERLRPFQSYLEESICALLERYYEEQVEKAEVKSAIKQAITPPLLSSAPQQDATGSPPCCHNSLFLPPHPFPDTVQGIRGQGGGRSWSS
jgi:hypothetical protein